MNGQTSAAGLTPALEVQAVTVSFGGFKALCDVSLEIKPGVVHGLIGPNGAGKTTLVNVLTGFQSPSAGKVVLGDHSVGELPAHQLRRRGIARTFQAGRLFKGLSVLDNLAATGVGLGYSRAVSEREAERVLAWMGIESLAGQLAAGLPYTDARRVGIARALMFQPAFLLLDEPAAGMSEQEAAELATLIRQIAVAAGIGVLLIEHNVALVLSLAEQIYVLDAGAVIAEGDAQHITQSEAVRDAYFGAQAEAA